MRFATAALSYAVAGPIGKVVSRSAKVPHAPFRWHNLAGPWFDNSIAVLEDRARRAVRALATRASSTAATTGTRGCEAIAEELVEPRGPGAGSADRAVAGDPVPGDDVLREREQEVLDDLHQRRVDPVLPARHLVRGLAEATSPATSGCTRFEAWGPRRCAPRIIPVSGSASSLAKPVVSSIAQP